VVDEIGYKQMQNIFFPKNLNLNDFDYELPENKIALFPNEKREQSKLLVFESFNCHCEQSVAIHFASEL